MILFDCRHFEIIVQHYIDWSGSIAFGNDLEWFYWNESIPNLCV